MVLVKGLPHGSATALAVHGEDAVWTVTDHLLASAVDALNVANWQRTKDGARGVRPPKPMPRPGVAPGARIGNAKGLDPDHVRERLAKMRGGVMPGGD